MAHYFITGIGTEVGKTFAACSIVHQNPHYHAIKPVLSGYEEDDNDAAKLITAMGAGEINDIAPWRFTAPLSPHLAAAQEGREINPRQLVEFCKNKMHAHTDLLIEAVGGVMVPIAPNWLVLDWMKELNIPIILVSSSYLGAINHTLLTIEALKVSGLPLHLVIINQADAEIDAGLGETKQALREFIANDVRIEISPRVQDSQSPWKNAAQLLSL